MTRKGVDGSNIRLTVLRTPIPLGSLEYEDARTRKAIPNVFALNAKKPSETHADKSLSIALLTEPISLGRIKWDWESRKGDSPITFNVKTVQSTYYSGKSRKMPNEGESAMLRQNIMTLLEYSTVYPFVYISNKFQCFVCSESFLDSNILKHHTDGHSMSEIQRELDKQARIKPLKVDVNTLQCKICSTTLTDLQSLKQHLNKDHDKDIAPEFQDNVIPFKLGGKTYECQVCQKTFLKLWLLIIHMSQHFNNYNCEVCAATFTTHSLFLKHSQIHKGGHFPCDKCSKVFNTSAKRSSHIRGVHLKRHPRRCPICSETFNSNYKRMKHLRIVHNETAALFKCETCGREYDLKYLLLLHVRKVHMQEKNHECSVCRARFFSKECMLRHMVVHTGDKKFKCDICGKAYARKKNLKGHMRTHESGPVACAICGECRDDHSSLAKHMNDAHRVM